MRHIWSGENVRNLKLGNVCLLHARCGVIPENLGRILRANGDAVAIATSKNVGSLISSAFFNAS